MIKQMEIMSIYILVGIYLQKKKQIPANCGQVLSFLIVEITTPCTVLSAFLNIAWNISVSEMAAVFIYYAAAFLCVMILAKLSGIFAGIDANGKGMWEFLLLFPNNIFIAFPVIESILGTEALVYASLACIPCNALIFSYGLYLAGKNSENYRGGLREILNPCTMVSGIALVLVIGNFCVPEFFAAAVKNIGSMSTPLSLIVMGMMIARTFRLCSFQKKEIWIFCILRLIIAPIVICCVFSLWRTPHMEIAWVMVLTAGMPASNMAIVLGERFQNNEAFATNCVVLSTLLFL